MGWKGASWRASEPLIVRKLRGAAGSDVEWKKLERWDGFIEELHTVAFIPVDLRPLPPHHTR